MPLGGSSVTLTPLCRMDTGNLSDGIAVSHRRKLSAVLSGVISSHMRSSVGSHDSAR
jgi:hypothetical protein